MANNETTRLKLLRQIAEMEENVRSLVSATAAGIKDTNNNLQKQRDLLKSAKEELVEHDKKLKDISDTIKKGNDFLEESEDLQASIADRLGKQSKEYKVTEKYIERQKSSLASIGSMIEKQGDTDFATKAKEAVDAYKKYQQSVASVANATSLTSEQQEQYNLKIARARAELDQSVGYLKDMGAEGEYVFQSLSNMADETQDFQKIVKKAKDEWSAMDAVLGSFSGIPAMGELNTLLKTNIRDTLAFKAAVFALGAALGKAAMDYFGAPFKARVQQEKEVAQLGIDGAAERAKIQSDANFISNDEVVKGVKNYTKIQEEADNNRIQTAHSVAQAMNEAAFAGQKAANQFAASMKQGAAQFNAAAKTALFGKGIGGIGYGAAQMNLAGIGADKVASAMEAAGAATGKMPTAKMGADMAIMAERTGQSVQSIADINEMFQRMDGVSASTAMNLQEGLRNMADQAGIGLGNLMREVAEASKDALSYQIKSGPALAKQVAYAQSLGVNFGDIAKAGKNMVMNYKDSIKAEMQLSSLLGEQVDLSEVRAKFAAGDTTGALESLKAQGLNPEDMDMFQQQALQDALGGMDLTALQKVATGQGAQVGGLKEASAKGGNQQFLGATQAAQATLSSQSAAISAQEAVIDAQLSGKIADSFINSDGHKTFLEAQAQQAIKTSALNEQMDKLWKSSDDYNKQLTATAQLNFKDTLINGLMDGAAALGGGLITTLGSSLIGKVMGKGKGGAPEPAAASGGGGGGSITDSVKEAGVGMVAGKADELVPGSGAVVEGLAGQVEAIEAPLEKAMSFGEKLKDLGAGIGGFIKEIGMGAGAAIKSVLQGLGQGLVSLSTGLISLTPAIPVVLAFGAALWMASPALEAIAPPMIKVAEVIGTVLVEALKQAGPIITSIFEGIGTVIKSIGTAISDVITAVGDSLVKIGSIDAINLMGVALALPVLAAGLVALGAGELINGIMSFVGSLFGGGGPSIWDKLIELAKWGPGLKQASDAVTPLAGAFVKLGDVDDGDNLDALLDNLSTAAKEYLTADNINLFKAAGPSLLTLGTGLNAISNVGTGSNLALLNINLLAFVKSKVDTSLAAMVPNISAFADSMTKLQTSFTGPAMQGFMTLSTLSVGLDMTTQSIIKMTEAFTQLAAINLNSLKGIPWKDMIGFGKTSGGSVVLAKTANNNFNVTQTTAKNIEKLTTDTKLNLQISRNLQALLAVLGDNQGAATKVIIDGRTVASMIQRRDENRKAMFGF